MSFGNPGIVYDSKPVDPSVSDLTYTNVTGGLSISAAEKINALTNIKGGAKVVARTVGPVTGVDGSLDLNAVSVGSVTNINGRSSVVAHQIDNFTNVGPLFANATNVGTITTIERGYLVVIGRAQSSSAPRPSVGTITGSSHKILICGMDVDSITNSQGKVTIVGGNVGTITNAPGVTIIGGTVRQVTNGGKVDIQ